MIEAVTAFFGVLSAGIFFAHAIESFRSSPYRLRSRRSVG
jgi:hypothetical protein